MNVLRDEQEKYMWKLGEIKRKIMKEYENKEYRDLNEKKKKLNEFVCLGFMAFCRLFNAKSIFIQINSSISNNSV